MNTHTHVHECTHTHAHTHTHTHTPQHTEDSSVNLESSGSPSCSDHSLVEIYRHIVREIQKIIFYVSTLSI